MTVTCPQLPERYEPLPSAEEALLGSGGMADVFRARDRLLGDAVAMKVVRREVMANPEFATRFQREVTASASVAHPNLVPLHDLGYLPDERPYLALAHADAGSLLELRRQNPPWQVLRSVLDETLAALACLHSHGLLHLDVKLSNVLLHRDDMGHLRAWLSDLGLVKALSQEEAFKGTLAGTLSYMPLEVLLRRYPEIGPQTDLFAVGVLIYRLVAATNPFKAEGVAAHIDLRYKPPTRLPVRAGLVVPPGLQDIVLTLLQPDPRARYDLAADLRNVLASLPSVETEASPDTDPEASQLLSLPTDVSLVDEPMIAKGDDPLSVAPDGVPPWRRPPRTPFRFRPEPEPGRGARARASLPLFALREIPMVGRDRERQALWDLAREVASSQRPSVVLLGGEAGVGKSRLLEGLRRSLEELGQGISVEIAFTEAGGPGDGYPGAVRRLLRLPGTDARETRARLERWLARDRGRLDDDVSRVAALLQRWAVPARGDAPVSSEVARQYLLEHLANHAWRGLSLLIVEDVQWCSAEDDGPALAASVLQLGLPVLVVLTTRNDSLQLNPVAARGLEALESLGARTLDLSRIPPEEMQDLVEECLPLEPGLMQEVVKRSEGNPLFARELIGQWARSDALEMDGADAGADVRFRLTSPQEKGIPDDIRAVFSARLSYLLRRRPSASGQVGQALDVVGVADSGTPWEVMLAAAGPGLDALVEGGFIHQRDEGAQPDHPLLAQLLRERVKGQALASAHESLARAWDKVGVGQRARLQVGHHLLAAGNHSEAVVHLAQAVEVLMVAGTAAELRGAALDLNRAVDASGEEGKARYLSQLALARADRASGNTPMAKRRLERLLESGPEGPAAVEVAAAYVETVDFHDRVNVGLKCLQDVEPEVREAPPGVRARYHEARAICLLHLGRHGPAEREVETALSLVDTDAMRAPLLLQLGRCKEQEDLDGAMRILDEARLLAESNGYLSVEAQALAVMARIHGIKGNWVAGREMAEEAERLAVTTGFHAHVPLCRNARAECLRFQGEIDAARTLYQEGRRWAAAMGQRAWVLAFDLNLALCAVVMGHLDALGERLAVIAEEGDPRWEPFAAPVLALEALFAVLERGDAEPLCGVPATRLVQEGLDGAFLAVALAKVARERGLDGEARRLEEAVQEGLARRGLCFAHLEPMLEIYGRLRAAELCPEGA